ncbi:MAG: hypothetical protein HY722_00390 [Planctomycetes bacterium]|nr:hypothetical protein [Planctomycetota bacterium]
MTRNLQFAVLAILLVLINTGCGILFRVDGNGPFENREDAFREVTTELPSRSLTERDAETLDRFYSPERKFNIGGRENLSTPFFGGILPGQYRYVEKWRHAKTGRTLGTLASWAGTGILLPGYVEFTSRSYDMESGELVAYSRSRLVMGLVEFGEAVGPEKLDFAGENLDFDRLRHERSATVLLGAFGTTRVNGKSYLRVVWVPILIW